jgi:flagellar biosynthesis protein FlhF
MALAHFVKNRRDIEVHLVLPATMKAVDLSSTVDRFEAFHPERFIFTRVDETNSFGGILNELARKGGSVSYLTNGQRIPEDLVVPSSSVLADLVLSEVCGKPAALVAA